MEQILQDEKKKSPFMEYAYWGKVDEMLYQLSRLAMEENWNYCLTEEEKPFPILYNYLSHTLYRIKEQGKIVKKGDYECFNTGLVTDHQEEIFAVFKNSERGRALFKFCSESGGLYVPEGQLQLLLPLCLKDPAKADDVSHPFWYADPK